MLISVVNHTDGKLSDEAVQEGIRAVNRQIAEDFNPNWSMGAELRLEGVIGKDPDDDKLPELRGDAIIYLWNEVDVEDALGYHEANAAGIPFGFVFTELVKQLKEPWTVTVSHEALELIGDPEANLLVAGPHPEDPKKEVFHWYEMCDAVQDETYEIDGVAVSNFVLPLYFTQFAEVGGRNDFLGRLTKGQTAAVLRHQPGRLHRLLQSQDARARDLLAQGRPPGARAAEDQGPRAAHPTLGALQARHRLQEGAGGDDGWGDASSGTRGSSSARAPGGRDDRSHPASTGAGAGLRS